MQIKSIFRQCKKHKSQKVISAIILFAFALSSCKKCPVVRTDENISNSRVGRYLKDKGADDAEIREMLKIEKEDFGENIGRVIYTFPNRYHYKGHGNGSAHPKSGLYAMKRLLFVLGKHNIVDKNLWYRYTDDQLRGMDLPPGQGQNETIDPTSLKILMQDLGVPPRYYGIYRGHANDDDEMLEVKTYDESIDYDTITYNMDRNNLAKFDQGTYDGPFERAALQEMLDLSKRGMERNVRMKREHEIKMRGLLNR